jgi:PilZ domain
MSNELKREQRRYERVKLSLNVNWGLTSQCETDARITSISQGGAFIQTKFTLLIDQTIFLRLMLRSEHVLRCRVRYTLHDVGSGVEFLELTEDDRSAVQELVSSYGPTTAA